MTAKGIRGSEGTETVDMHYWHTFWVRIFHECITNFDDDRTSVNMQSALSVQQTGSRRDSEPNTETGILKVRIKEGFS